MKILCVIPSRINSTRLPRKPLVDLAGKPMIQRVYEAAIQCPEFSKVIVATDSLEIESIIKGIQGNVEQTEAHHLTGSDRVAEVASRYPEMDIIVNLQGDEPFIRPEMLSTLVKPFIQGESFPMTTLAYPLDFEKDYSTSSVVKVVFDKNFKSLYFSRSPLPFFQKKLSDLEKKELPVLHHMGVYAYKRDFLKIYTQLKQTPLELAESLEQLRALENGYDIRVCPVKHKTLEINTPEELMEAQKWALEFFR
jgi:3-deoxy-manno-octulosonate cytidylyltransferase (CMP-KDO synthetase)